QRGARDHRAADDAVGLRDDPGAGLLHLPGLARDDRLLPAADAGDLPRLLVHEGAGHRAHGRHAAGDGAGRWHRRRLRVLHLRPASAAPGAGRQQRRRVQAGADGDRHRDDLHGDHAVGGRGHLVVLGPEVPGRHGHAADLHVHGEHGHGDHLAAGAGGDDRRAGAAPAPGARAVPRPLTSSDETGANMFERLVARLSREPDAPPSADRAQLRQLAVAALLVEAVHADRHADAGEREAVVSRLREHFDLPVDEAEHLVELAEGRFAAALDDWIFANAVRRGFAHDERVDILGMIWDVVYSDGRLAAFEMNLLQRLSEALDVDPASAEAARARAFAR